jgi:uncharacterized protein YqgV (UPF0045/DUF77 family)
MFTEIEGEWDEVMEVVKRATLAVAEHGTRVSLVLKADYRPGHTGELDGKVQRGYVCTRCLRTGSVKKVV